jgi:hypothetical protein
MAQITPDPIMRIAMGFMAAKHLFVANEIGCAAPFARLTRTRARAFTGSVAVSPLRLTCARTRERRLACLSSCRPVRGNPAAEGGSREIASLPLRPIFPVRARV